MQEAKRQFFDSLFYYPQREKNVWGSPLLIAVLFIFQASPIHAQSDSDIIDRRDVQSILFGNDSGSNYFNHESDFRGEFIGAQRSVALNAYYLKRLNPYFRSQWGASYEEFEDKTHIVGLRGGIFLSWERYFLQPIMGLDGGYGIAPNNERNLFSRALLGLDMQLAHNFGISTRETWGFSNNSFALREPFYFRFENAMFEVALFWQI